MYTYLYVSTVYVTIYSYITLPTWLGISMNHPIYNFLQTIFQRVTSRENLHFCRFLLPISPWAFALDRSRQGLHADLKGASPTGLSVFFWCAPSLILPQDHKIIHPFWLGLSSEKQLWCHPGMPSTTSSYALRRSLATVQCTPGWTSENLRSIASQRVETRGQKVPATAGWSQRVNLQYILLAWHDL